MKFCSWHQNPESWFLVFPLETRVAIAGALFLADASGYYHKTNGPFSSIKVLTGP